MVLVESLLGGQTVDLNCVLENDLLHWDGWTQESRHDDHDPP